MKTTETREKIMEKSIFRINVYMNFFLIKIIKNDESIQKSGNVENAKLASFQMDK